MEQTERSNPHRMWKRLMRKFVCGGCCLNGRSACWEIEFLTFWFHLLTWNVKMNVSRFLLKPLSLDIAQRFHSKRKSQFSYRQKRNLDVCLSRKDTFAMKAFICCYRKNWTSRLEQTWADSTRFEQTWADSAGLEPTRADWARFGPARADLARLAQTRVDSSQLGLLWLDSGWLDWTRTKSTALGQTRAFRCRLRCVPVYTQNSPVLVSESVFIAPRCRRSLHFGDQSECFWRPVGLDAVLTVTWHFLRRRWRRDMPKYFNVHRDSIKSI